MTGEKDRWQCPRPRWAVARSTWVLPSTSRRVSCPCRSRSFVLLLALLQVGDNQLADAVRLLDVREMGGARDHLEPRAADAVRDPAPMLRRRGLIVSARDHERRRLDRGEVRTQIHLRQ